ncbi:MAG: hypothetical protein KC416_03850 [Myxococcales bacterium]|nr:hypothetical protein [Myxococcales bacterium]
MSRRRRLRALRGPLFSALTVAICAGALLLRAFVLPRLAEAYQDFGTEGTALLGATLRGTWMFWTSGLAILLSLVGWKTKATAASYVGLVTALLLGATIVLALLTAIFLLGDLPDQFAPTHGPRSL